LNHIEATQLIYVLLLESSDECQNKKRLCIGVQLTLVRPDNSWPHCGANNSELSSLPIMLNEPFTFDYKRKCGVELEFRPRPKSS
jgi:hypothetical protein